MKEWIKINLRNDEKCKNERIKKCMKKKENIKGRKNSRIKKINLDK